MLMWKKIENSNMSEKTIKTASTKKNIAVSFSLTALLVATCSHGDNTILKDDFELSKSAKTTTEQVPSGWKTLDRHGVGAFQSCAYEGNGCATLLDKGGVKGRVVAWRTFPKVDGGETYRRLTKCSFKFKIVKFETDKYNDAYVNFLEKHGVFAKSLEIGIFNVRSKNLITLKTNSGKRLNKIMNLNLGVWYTVALDAFDFKEKVCDITVTSENGETKKIEKIKFRGHPKFFSEIQIRSGLGDAASQILFDDIIIKSVGSDDTSEAKPSDIQNALAKKVAAYKKKSPEAPGLIESKRFVTIVAGNISLSFDKRTSILLSYYDSSTGTEYIDPASINDSEGIWKLHLRDYDTLKNKVEAVPSDGLFSYSVEDSKDSVAITLRWDNLKINGVPTKMNAVAKITSRVSERKVVWDFSVENANDKFVLWSVDYPILSLAPIGEKTDDVLSVPLRWGYANENPFDETGSLFSYEGLQSGKSCPGWMGMQYFALYSKTTKTGLMHFINDDGINFKNYYITPEDSRLETFIQNFPSNIGRETSSYRLQYEITTFFIKGDWYDAAKRYRQWALKRKWCDRGRIIDRKDVPDWEKRNPIVFVARTGGYPENRKVNLGKIESIVELKKYFGVPATTLWYGWQHCDLKHTKYPTIKGAGAGRYHNSNVHNGCYFPPVNGFGEMVARLRENDIKPVVFVSSLLFDSANPNAAEAKPNVVRNEFGELVDYSKGYKGFWAMCRDTEWQQRSVASTSLELFEKWGVKGIYLDCQGLNSQRWMCFARNHHHDIGGGTTFSEGNVKLAEMTRRTLAAKGFDFTLHNENGGEDSLISVDTKLFHNNLQNGRVPLYAAVYHDYQLSYGRKLQLTDGLETKDPINIMIAGNLFINGAQIGRIESLGSKGALRKLLNEKHYFAKVLRFIKKLARYKYAGWKYLNVGEMKRPPNIHCADTVRTAIYRLGAVTKPALMGSCWKHPHKDKYAVVLVNISEKTQKYDFKIGKETFGALMDGEWRIDEMNEDGATKFLRTNDFSTAHPIVFHGQVDPLNVRFFIVSKNE